MADGIVELAYKFMNQHDRRKRAMAEQAKAEQETRDAEQALTELSEELARSTINPNGTIGRRLVSFGERLVEITDAGTAIVDATDGTGLLPRRVSDSR